MTMITARSIKQELGLPWDIERMIDAVFMIVSDVFMVDEDDLKMPGKRQPYVNEARFAVYSLLYEVGHMTKRAIAKIFGRVSRGICYGISVCEGMIQDKPYYAESYYMCKNRLINIL